MIVAGWGASTVWADGRGSAELSWDEAIVVLRASELGSRRRSALEAVRRHVREAIAIVREHETEWRFHQLSRGWYQLSGFEGIKFGWKLRVDVVRPNEFGAMMAPAPWTVFFRDGRIIAFCRPTPNGLEQQIYATELLPDGRVRGAIDDH